MSGRSTALIVGLLAMLIGIGMFLWDWYGEYIHFVWFIPFFILGPMIFIFGLAAVVAALLPSRKSFKKTMPPKESTETVRRYPAPPPFKLNVKRMEKRKDIEGLIKALKHKDEDVRISAAMALGEIGDTRAVDPLVQALKDEDEDVVKHADNALEKIDLVRSRSLRQKYHDDVKDLIKALRHRDKDVRISAAMALGEIGDTRAVEPLIQALKDENWLVRRGVVVALGSIADARAVDPLVQALKDKVNYVRMLAAETLGWIGDVRAVEPVIQALKDEDKDVRMSAAWALGRLGDARAVDPLTQALKDKNLTVQKALKEALQKIKAKKS